jgi:hypothetical protein
MRQATSKDGMPKFSQKKPGMSILSVAAKSGKYRQNNCR